MKTVPLILALLIWAVTAQANSVIVDTFGPGEAYNNTGYLLQNAYSYETEVAAAFTPSSNASIGTIDFAADGISGLGFHLYLYSDSGGTPGASLAFLGSATLTGPSFTGQILSVNVGGSVSLTQNQTYWLVVIAESGQIGDWLTGAPPSNGSVAFQSNSGGWAVAGAVPLPAFLITSPAAVPDTGAALSLFVLALVFLGLFAAKKPMLHLGN